MSKYLCQDCKSNNNGWCVVRKCNGLKKLNITSCNTYEDKNTTTELSNGNKIANIPVQELTRGKRSETKIFLDESSKNDFEAHRVLGKREMLWKIQRQIVAINQDKNSNHEEKYNHLVDSIKSLGIHLEFEEQLWEVNDIVESVIDENMIKDSKYMNSNLL